LEPFKFGLKEMGVTQVQFVESNDDWLQKRRMLALDAVGIDWIPLDDPHFLTPTTVFTSALQTA